MIRRTLPRLRSHLLYETSKLKFSCTECGKCCKGRTNVFVNEIEVSQLAEHLEMHQFDFISKYTEDRDTPDGVLTSLISKDNKKECIFLNGKKCSVYDARPTQCRTYPYWPQNLIGESEWKKEATKCEGIDIKTFDISKIVNNNNDINNYIKSDSNNNSKTDAIMNLIVHQVHGKGLGANYIYEDSLEFLEDSINLNKDLLTDFVDDFTNTYYSNILFENKEIKVIETSIPIPNPPIIDGEESLLQEFHEREVEEDINLKTFRRLEFISSPLLTQTEVQMIEDESLILPYSPTSSPLAPSIKIVDHSTLLMPVHRVISYAIKSILNKNINKNNRICIIGAGGCSLPMHILNTIKNKERIVIDAIEPNSIVLDIAKEFFSTKFTVPEDEFVNADNILIPHLMDGNTFIFYTKNLYEIIVVDAFENCEVDNIASTTFNNIINTTNKDNNNTNTINNIEKEILTRAPPISILSEIDIYISSLHEDGGMLIMNIWGDLNWLEEVRSKMTQAAIRNGFDKPPIIVKIMSDNNDLNNYVLLMKKNNFDSIVNDIEIQNILQSYITKKMSFDDKSIIDTIEII